MLNDRLCRMRNEKEMIVVNVRAAIKQLSSTTLNSYQCQCKFMLISMSRWPTPFKVSGSAFWDSKLKGSATLPIYYRGHLRHLTVGSKKS